MTSGNHVWAVLLNDVHEIKRLTVAYKKSVTRLIRFFSHENCYQSRCSGGGHTAATRYGLVSLTILATCFLSKKSSFYLTGLLSRLQDWFDIIVYCIASGLLGNTCNFHFRIEVVSLELFKTTTTQHLERFFCLLLKNFIHEDWPCLTPLVNAASVLFEMRFTNLEHT